MYAWRFFTQKRLEKGKLERGVGVPSGVGGDPSLYRTVLHGWCCRMTKDDAGFAVASLQPAPRTSEMQGSDETYKFDHDSDQLASDNSTISDDEPVRVVRGSWSQDSKDSVHKADGRVAKAHGLLERPVICFNPSRAPNGYADLSAGQGGAAEGHAAGASAWANVVVDDAAAAAVVCSREPPPVPRSDADERKDVADTQPCRTGRFVELIVDKHRAKEHHATATARTPDRPSGIDPDWAALSADLDATLEWLGGMSFAEPSWFGLTGASQLAVLSKTKCNTGQCSDGQQTGGQQHVGRVGVPLAFVCFRLLCRIHRRALHVGRECGEANKPELAAAMRNSSGTLQWQATPLRPRQCRTMHTRCASPWPHAAVCGVGSGTPARARARAPMAGA